MKVLFAVNNENVSEAIIKGYKKEYGEQLEYKNVYYFNAIQKELQRDKTYGRVVILEDLETFANTNFETIDKFISDRLDFISEEVKDDRGKMRTSIILICTDRREKGSAILKEWHSMGIYNALLGEERSIRQVCALIKNPRNAEEAVQYYKIDVNNSNKNGAENSGVSEVEIQNILIHYKKIGKNEEKYVESFNNIASQYTDLQLKVIISFLPLNVKAVLEAQSPKYQQLMTFAEPKNLVEEKIIEKSKRNIRENIKNNIKNKTQKKASKTVDVKAVSQEIEVIKNVQAKKKTLNSVIIPSTKNLNNAKKIVSGKKEGAIKKITKNSIGSENVMRVSKNEASINANNKINSVTPVPQMKKAPKIQEVEVEQPVTIVENVKRGRGRPRKNPIPTAAEIENKPKRGRGRPRKNPIVEEDTNIDVVELESKTNINLQPQVAQKIKVPTKVRNEEDNTNNVLLPGMDDEDEINNILLPEIDEDEDDGMLLPGMDDEEDDDDEMLLPGMDDDDEDDDEMLLPGMDDDDDDDEMLLPGMDDDEDDDDEMLLPGIDDEEDDTYVSTKEKTSYAAPSIKPQIDYSMSNLNSLLTKDKKIAIFVGTTKNGTSFLVNNMAELFSSIGVNTAILDMTRNRNSYFMYTNNEEELRRKAVKSIEKLKEGYADGIKAKKNLTIYTADPDDDVKFPEAEAILSTLVQNHSLVLIDSDYETDPAYFALSQQIYLVQSMDILTIQPITAFLKDLKTKGVLESEKLRVIINKEVKVNRLTNKMLIGGMSRYTDASMSVMTQLFDKETIKACTIPFDETVYAKYLESLLICKVSISGYPKKFKEKLKILGEFIYPLNSKQTYAPRRNPEGINTNFNSSINNTLNQMRQKY